MAKGKKGLKKPKAKKFPKKPKASANLASWEKWKEKVIAVSKQNEEALKGYEAAKKRVEHEEKKKKSIMEFNPKAGKRARR